MKNSFLILVVLIFFISCEKENEIKNFLTNGSSSMWDMPIIEKRMIGEQDSIIIQRSIGLLFHEDYKCERFNVGKTKRTALRIGPKVNVTGLCNKWKILNDSTIKLNCKDIFVVKMISKDTLYLLDTLGVKKHEMYRVSQPWNIDEKSVKIRDKLIESEEYLSPYIYY